jgi:hyperosmotically inducible protein
MKRHEMIMLLTASALFGAATIPNVYAQSSPANAQAEKVNYAKDGQAAAVDDTMITSKVRAAIGSDPRTSTLKIDVNTKQGVVFVTGAVPSDELREHVVQLIATVDGVRTVKNDLKITAPENQ